MKDLGEYLKNLRQSLGLSLNDVYKQTGISDSVISHIEKGDTQLPSPAALKKLAALYGIEIISLYLLCGYLEKDDLFKYERCFKGTEYLSEEEKNTIQQLINYLQKNRGTYNEI